MSEPVVPGSLGGSRGWCWPKSVVEGGALQTRGPGLLGSNVPPAMPPPTGSRSCRALQRALGDDADWHRHTYVF